MRYFSQQFEAEDMFMMILFYIFCFVIAWICTLVGDLVYDDNEVLVVNGYFVYDDDDDDNIGVLDVNFINHTHQKKKIGFMEVI